MPPEFTFCAAVWQYTSGQSEGGGAWYFVTLPRQVSDEIRALVAGSTKAFGTVKVLASLGRTRWRTSLFPDKKREAYVLPLKAAVREREQVQAGEEIEVCLVVEAPAIIEGLNVT